tara:strand:- start:54 stop:314 length:261 start_codon:yes stop_codon:yes gene_type:complete
MANYTITLTDAQVKALETVMVDIEDWIEHQGKSRALKAQKLISQLLLNHCNEKNIAMAQGLDAQVDQAYTLGLVKKASAEAPSPPE